MEPCWYQVEHSENVRRNSETFRRIPSQASDPTPSPTKTSKPALLWLQLRRPVVLRIRWVWAQDLQACAHMCTRMCSVMRTIIWPWYELRSKLCSWAIGHVQTGWSPIGCEGFEFLEFSLSEVIKVSEAVPLWWGADLLSALGCLLTVCFL